MFTKYFSNSNKNLLSLEILGQGVGSINYEHMLGDIISIRAGLGYASFLKGIVNISIISLPIYVNYLGVRSGNNIFELGGGLIVRHITVSSDIGNTVTLDDDLLATVPGKQSASGLVMGTGAFLGIDTKVMGLILG